MCNRGQPAAASRMEEYYGRGSADPHTTANTRIHDFGCGMAGTNQAGHAYDVRADMLIEQ